MNALLVYPKFPDTFWSLKYALRFIRKRATMPPLGLLTVAAMLPAAWSKRLVDVNVSNLDDSDLAWADIVLISGMIVQQESACQLIDRCQRAGVKVVAGGPLFTGDPDRFAHVEHLILNEAEVTLPLFLADLENGRAQHIYRTDEFADVRTTPPPLWSIAHLRRYASMAIQFSRGCPFDCEFCNVTAMFGRRPRTKSTEQILGELDNLYELGWRGPVFFVDDNLIGNKKELRALLPALIEWR
ncbi:MAG: cobalamin-dependent protein, partial [Tepidisphaeraceae bacterium]